MSAATYGYWTVVGERIPGKHPRIPVQCRCGKRADVIASHLTSGQSQSCGCARRDKPVRLCSVEGCDGRHEGNGYCVKHRERWKTHGNPLHESPTPETRFAKRYEVAPSGCWLWTAALNANGYGEHYVGDRSVLAHRFSYELLVGPIPADLQLDHLCRVRHCVNPDHLEPVTQRINILRGESPGARAVRHNRCAHGHEYDEANTYWRKDGKGRDCRACHRERKRVRAA